MANAFKGQTAVEHNGETYTLVLDFNALCSFEDATGKNALDVMAKFEAGKASVSDLRALFWSAMQDAHPSATLKDAGAILSADPDAMARLVRNMSPTVEDAADMGNAKARSKAA